MKSNESKLDNFGHLLREARPSSELSPDFQKEVWRRIEHAETLSATGPTENWLERLSGWFLMPRLALSGMAAMLLAGAVLGALDAANLSKQTVKERYITAVSPHALR